MSSAQQMAADLGPALCLAKWKQVSLHLQTGMNNSCYHPPLHSIDPVAIAQNPGALHNTEHKKQQRVIMLRDQRPAECQYCWNMEDLGELSDRHYRSGEPWAAVDFEQIRNSTGQETDVIPAYVEVNFNNACNLRCSYCSPQYSSSWAEEANRHGAYPTSTPHNSPDYFAHGNRRPIPAREANPYVEAFWQWWPTLYPRLRHFRMTGGEPLMDKNTYRVFDYVLEHPHPELHLDVTSNFSVEPELFERYLTYVKKLCDTNIDHFMQYVSLDSGIARQAEYIRDGLDFARLETYVNRYLDEAPYRNSLTFIVTMNNLSVTGFRPLMERILELRKKFTKTYQRVWFDTPVLRQPAWQSLQLLPESYAQQLESTADWMAENLDDRHGFRDYEVQRLRRDIMWQREAPSSDLNHDKADFFRFFQEHDRRRNTDFLHTFPEMRVFWAECEYHARS